MYTIVGAVFLWLLIVACVLLFFAGAGRKGNGDDAPSPDS